MAIEGVDQPGYLRQGVADLATGAVADPQAVIDVHQRPPAVPFRLGAPKCLIRSGLTGTGQHGLEEWERHRPDY